MVRVGTLINIIDNSGAERARCIHIYSKTSIAKPGDKILLTVRRVRVNSKIKKGQIYKGLLVRSAYKQPFLGGHFTQATLSAAILLKKNGDILGTRFSGPVFWKLHRKRLSKALSLFENLY